MRNCEILVTMPNTEPATVYYDKALLKKIDLEAKAKGCSRSDIIRWAVIRYLHQEYFGEKQP